MNEYALIPDKQHRQDALYRGLHGFYTLEKYQNLAVQVVMFTAMFSLGVLVTLEVVFRYWLKLPILGVMELAPLLASWAYFAGMIHAARRQEHIAGGIADLIIKNETLKIVTRLFVAIVCVGVIIALTYYSIVIGINIFNSNRKSPYLQIPRIYWNLSIILGFACMIPYYLLDIILNIRLLKLSRK